MKLNMKKVLLSLFLLVIVANHLPAQSVQQKMDDLLDSYLKEKKFNGSVLVGHKGQVVYEKGLGYRNAEDKVPNDVNSIFQIGSITKQFTAAVIMQLQEEGKLSVQDKLSKYYPGFANGDKITIEHLLTHTSGIYNYTNDTTLMKSDVTKHYSQSQMVEMFKKYPPDFEPGTKWNYSNSGYSLLGYIIEKVTGKPYERVVRERILQPLGMSHSGFDFAHVKDAEKAKGYFTLASTKATPAPIVDSTIAYSAGALYSTVEDLYKWEKAIKTDKILKPASWNRIFTPYMNKYGYGWGIDSLYGKLTTSHSGGIHGFSSFLLRVPEEDLVVIMMDNSSSGALGKLSKTLAAIALDKPYDLPTAKKEIQVDHSILSRYTGEYQLAPTFSITVRLDGNQLKAQATGQPEFELFPEKENLFFLKVVDAKVEFIKDDAGNVTEMVLYQNGMTPRGKKIK